MKKENAQERTYPPEVINEWPTERILTEIGRMADSETTATGEQLVDAEENQYLLNLLREAMHRKSMPRKLPSAA